MKKSEWKPSVMKILSTSTSPSEIYGQINLPVEITTPSNLGPSTIHVLLTWISGLCVSFLKSYSANRGYSISIHLQHNKNSWVSFLLYLWGLNLCGKQITWTRWMCIYSTDLENISPYGRIMLTWWCQNVISCKTTGTDFFLLVQLFVHYCVCYLPTTGLLIIWKFIEKCQDN